MKVRIRSDAVEIEGYVNAVERASKPILERIGQCIVRCIERIAAGAFGRALQRNDDVHILLNHDWSRDLGSQRQGNLELTEDAIGLHARATITDPDVIEDARNGDLVGWSFGFRDVDVDDTGKMDGLPLRVVHDLDLREVSLLNRTKSPAYVGTLVSVRDDGSDVFHIGEEMIPETVETRNEEPEPEAVEDPAPEAEPEAAEEPEGGEEVPKQQKPVVDYTPYDQIIKTLKGA